MVGNDSADELETRVEIERERERERKKEKEREKERERYKKVPWPVSNNKQGTDIEQKQMVAYQSCNSFVEVDGSGVFIVQYFKKSTEITVIIVCASKNVCKLVCVFHHWVGRSVSVTW